MTLSARVCVAIALATFVSSCGGGSPANEARTVEGDKTFEGEGYSFTYPGRWVQRTDLESAGGSGGGVWFGPPEGADILYIGTSGLTVPITVENIAAYSDELVADTDRVFREAQGQVTTEPEHVTVAGLPALRLEASAINVNGIQTKSHVVLVYDGKTEYFLNCQYTPEGAAEMTAGCDQVIASFKVEGRSTESSSDVVIQATRDAQQVLSEKSAFYDSLSEREQHALDELQALLATDSGITPEEVARTRSLLRILDKSQP
jgi:hypothetical protein